MNSNNYKDKKVNIRMNKRAQATIFIIVALAIVAIFVILILLTNGNPFSQNIDSINPESYLRECIEPSVKENVELLSKNGGYSKPEGILNYNDQTYKYLCYVSENYKPCIVQQALLKEQFEKELNILTKSKAEECVLNLKKEYESRGYDFNSQNTDVKFYIVPQNIKYQISGTIEVKKGEVSRYYNGFDVKIKSELYDLLLISISIIDFESTYGDSETTSYIQYYPDLKIDKTRLSEGSKIYRVSNVVTKEEFAFATRSLVFPPGYGLQ